MLDGIAGFLISLPHFIADEKMSTDGVTLPNSTIGDNSTSSRMLCTDRAAALADQEVGKYQSVCSSSDEKMSTDGVTLPNTTIRDNTTSGRMLCTVRAAALADQEVGKFQ